MNDAKDKLPVFIGFIAVIMAFSAFSSELERIEICIIFISISLKTFLVFSIIGLALAMYLYVIVYYTRLYTSKYAKILTIIDTAADVIVVFVTLSPFILGVAYVLNKLGLYVMKEVHGQENSYYLSLLVSFLSGIQGCITVLISVRGALKRRKLNKITEIEAINQCEAIEKTSADKYIQSGYNSMAIIELYKAAVMNLKSKLTTLNIYTDDDDDRIFELAQNILDLDPILKIRLLEFRKMRNMAVHTQKEITDYDVMYAKSIVENLSDKETNMQNNEKIETLCKAINERKSISFEYSAPNDNIAGLRYGNPHVIYIATNKSGPENVLIELYQTGGPSQSIIKTGWRSPKIKYMSNIQILDGVETFKPAPGFNPNSTKYTRPICKIK